MTFQQMVETIFAGIAVIALMQFYRLSNTWIAERSIKAVKIIEAKSTGQMFRMTSSIFYGIQVKEIKLADIEYEDDENPDDSPLPAAFNRNPLEDAKRHAALILRVSRRETGYDKFATEILGSRDIKGLGHKPWGRAIDYMVKYHGVIKGQPGKLSECSQNGEKPATLEILQHAIRVHQLPPAPARNGDIS